MDKDLIIVKSNSFVEASYQMTLDETRLLSMSLSVLDPQNPKNNFEFSVAEFSSNFPDVDPKSAYTQVKNAIKRISTRWITLVDNENELTEVSLVTKRSYFKNEGKFLIFFHDDIMPYISNLKERFTQYHLKNIVSFKSTNSIRLYELLAQYKSLGKRFILLDDLKSWFKLEDKYPRFNSFNQRVLAPAIKEINENSDLKVSFEQVKRSKIVFALDFTINFNGEIKNVAYTKTGRLKLPKRPKVVVGSHGEGEWARECIKILNDYRDLLKENGQKLSTEDYKLLMNFHSILGDTILVEQIKNLLRKREEKEKLAKENKG